MSKLSCWRAEDPQKKPRWNPHIGSYKEPRGWECIRYHTRKSMCTCTCVCVCALPHGGTWKRLFVGWQTSVAQRGWLQRSREMVSNAACRRSTFRIVSFCQRETNYLYIFFIYITIYTCYAFYIIIINYSHLSQL